MPHYHHADQIILNGFSGGHCVFCKQNLKASSAKYHVCYDHLHHMRKNVLVTVRQKMNRRDGLGFLFGFAEVITLIGGGIGYSNAYLNFSQTWGIWLTISLGFLLLYYFNQRRYNNWIKSLIKNPMNETEFTSEKEMKE
jgi:hypothetical protein